MYRRYCVNVYRCVKRRNTLFFSFISCVDKTDASMHPYFPFPYLHSCFLLYRSVTFHYCFPAIWKVIPGNFLQIIGNLTFKNKRARHLFFPSAFLFVVQFPPNRIHSISLCRAGQLYFMRCELINERVIHWHFNALFYVKLDVNKWI